MVAVLLEIPATEKTVDIFLAPLTIVRRSLSDTNLSGVRRPASVGVRQLFQIATSPTFFNGFF